MLSDLFHRRISMWTIGTHPFFILLLTKDELFKGITPLKEKKKEKKEKNWNFKLTAHFFVTEIQQETKLTSHMDSY